MPNVTRDYHRFTDVVEDTMDARVLPGHPLPLRRRPGRQDWVGMSPSGSTTTRSSRSTDRLPRTGTFVTVGAARGRTRLAHVNFEVSEKMEIILTMVSEFMRDEVIPLEGEMLHGSSEELARLVAAAQVKVRQMGLWAPNHPVEYGGLGLSMVDHALLSEALGRSPLGHLVFGTQAPDAGNVEILHAHATAEQRERFLRPLVEGEIRSCFSMTEPEMPGSNPVMMGTTAVVDGDDYVINGQKWFTSSADGAAFAIVMAVTNPDAPPTPAGQHDHRSDRHSRFQPGPQRERDGPRRIRACEPCRGHLRVVPGATIAPARPRGQRLRDRPGAARPGTHPPLHALAGHRRPIVRSHVRSSERTSDHSRRRARSPTDRSSSTGWPSSMPRSAPPDCSPCTRHG